jgi:hypothetical protein
MRVASGKRDCGQRQRDGDVVEGTAHDMISNSALTKNSMAGSM